MHRVGIVLVVVDADDERAVNLTLGGSGQDDLLGAALDVAAKVGCRAELARAVEHDVDAQLAPGKGGDGLGLAGGETLDAGRAVDDEVHAIDDQVVCELAVDGVAAAKLRHGLSFAQVVDGHDLDIGIVESSAERHAPDATEAVDTDSDRHAIILLNVGSTPEHRIDG